MSVASAIISICIAPSCVVKITLSTRVQAEILLTLIIDRPISAARPAVHVLIVAVGDYPHLEDGSSKTKFEKHAGMGQLSSPSVSARRVVDWFKSEYTPYESTLSTVDVLCSGAQSFEDENGNEVAVERANLVNVRSAVTAWYKRGNLSERNTLIFYFCGHGVTTGAVSSLLLEDFGSEPLDPFSSGAVDAGGFMNGMRTCKALNQLYLLDACRNVPSDYLLDFGEHRGVPLVSSAKHTNLGVSHQVCIWASELGKAAYARPRSPTIFTDAWLAAMKGAGARMDGRTFDWVIQGTALTEGINEFIKRSEGAEKQFATPGVMTMGFPIHVLDGLPLVPVNVICKPTARSADVELTCEPGGLKVSGLTGPWHLELKHGAYSVNASACGSGQLLDTQQCLAAPPVALVAMRLEN